MKGKRQKKNLCFIPKLKGEIVEDMWTQSSTINFTGEKENVMAQTLGCEFVQM